MKKFLGIVGSPRKNGNTHVLVSRILDGARAGGADTESVFLGDLQLSECDGCHACWKGKHACSKKDDMSELYPKISNSDVLIFGTPVYWFGPTAIMKCFIDRLVYFNCPANRKKIRGKPAAIAVPFEDTARATSDLVVKIFDRSFDYLEVNFAGKILVPGVTRRGEVRRLQRVMDKCYKLGKRLAVQPMGGFA